jgi:hypothetical protein
MTPRPDARGKLPSEFDGCLKLDVLGDAVADPRLVLQCIAVGHPDAISRGFSFTHTAPFAFQSVFFDAKRAEGSSWMPAYRFLATSYQRVHMGLFTPQVPLKWKCLYEVIVHNRARNLYFDLDQTRPAGMSKDQHDRRCWAKVQLLRRIVCESFRYVIGSLMAVLRCFTVCLTRLMFTQGNVHPS